MEPNGEQKLGRKERERERRRNEIIDAAEKLFFSKGYENVTMDDIAKEMELARPTLYLSFKNKEEIYLAIATRGSLMLNQMFKQCVDKNKNGIENLRSISRAFCDFNLKFPGYLVADWYSQTVSYDESGYPRMDQLKKIRVETFSMAVEAFKQGIRDGSVKKNADPLKGTLLLMSALQGVLNLTPAVEMHMKNLGLTQEEIIEFVREHLLNSFENKK